MNKIKKYFLVAFGLAFAVMLKTPIVNAANLDYSFTGYYYERFDQDGNNYVSWKLEDYYVDGETAYCIEPGTPEGTPIYPASWSDTGISNDVKERVLLIGYYGEQYPGHKTLRYKAATQGMIWATILGNNTTIRYSTERYGEGNILDVSSEMAEIERLIAHHYDRPSFNAGVYKLQVGETLTLTDTNNVLQNFDISVSGAEYSVNGNTLTIKPTTDGTINLSMTKKQVYTSPYKLFVGDGKQNMFVPGTVDPVIARIRVNSYYSTVEINKKDKETNTNVAQGQATLENAVYGVFEKSTGNQVATITTDSNGYGKSDKVLSYNEYYIQEISSSNGYLLDNTRYDINLKGKENESIDVFEQILKNYISILKQYDYVDGNTTFLNAEKDITFEIYYPNGDKFSEITTDKNGYATINLPFGIWKFHQVNTNTGYEKIYDFYVTVDYDSEEEQYYNILNNALSAYLQVFKTDLETGKTIALKDTTFKIYNKDTQSYVSQFVGGKVYDEFKTDEEGKFITYLKLVAGNYKLIEVNSPKGYLLDENGMDFTIGEDTHYSYTTYGPFITVYFENAAIKGQIEIIKSGETFTIENGTFNYNEKISLDNISFNIYAYEDIKSSDGNFIYYNAGDLVETITTNEDGYAISMELPLGKYIVKEISTKDEFVLDDEEHIIEITELDNKTAIVYSRLEMTNLLKKGTLEFTKTDLVTGEVIPNTTIEIYTENDELIFTGETDENGKIIIDNLKVGKYYILEKNAPEPYILNDEKMWFEILENGEIVKAVMKDEKVVVEVPNTIKEECLPLAMFGVMVLGMGVIGYGAYKSKKK